MRSGRVTAGGIEARPVGRTLRLLVGGALMLEAGRWLLKSGAGPWVLAAGVVVGEVAFYALLQLAIQRFVPSIHRWLGALMAVGPVVAVYLLSGPPGKLGTLLFVGISLVLTALRNDGGCEVMTLPGMILGRRTHLVCLAFSPVDWLEERLGGA